MSPQPPADGPGERRGGSERSSHPRGDGRRGRRAFRGAHRSGRAVGPMAVADTRCAPAVGGGVSGTALGVGAPLGSGALDPSEFPPGKSAAPRERLRAAPTGGGRRKWGWEGNKGNAAGRRRGAEPGSGCRSPNVGQWGNAPPAPTPAPSAAFVWRCPPAPLPAPLVCGGRIASHGIARGRGHTHPVRGDAGRCGGTLTSPLPPGTNKAPIVCGAASCRVLRCGVGFFSFAFSFLTQLSSNSQRRRTAVSAPSFSCRVGSFLSCLFSLSSFFPPPPRKHSSWHHQHRGPPSRGVSIGGRRWPHPTHLHRGLCVLRWGKRTHLAGDAGWQFVLWPSFISRRNSKKE